ncbi:MAG TPA: ABC transporter substrate-binding protein [Thermomicrobiales bacterium]|jgi:iron complex transport system substrate-binding protein|nr:ABC transporter substrate-binding protein [Thermomicrobiales bacterium]
MSSSFSRRGAIAGGLAIGASAFTVGRGRAQGDATPAATPGATPDATPTAASGTQPDGSWLFVDDRGTEIRLDAAPQRVVAELSVAAALLDLGVETVGVFGVRTNQDGSPAVTAGQVDLDAVTFLGEGFDDFDIELLVSLEPDLIVTTLYGQLVWRLNEDAVPTIEELAPVAGINVQGVSAIDLIERFADLAAALGADLESDQVTAARTAFEASSDAVREAVASNPDLSILFVTGATDTYYVGNAMAAGDLMYFVELGVVIPQTVDTSAYWESRSWEETNAYLTDVIQIDRRPDWLTYEQMLEQQTFALLPAVQADQVGTWDVEYVNSYQGFTPVLDRLAETIRTSDGSVA